MKGAKKKEIYKAGINSFHWLFVFKVKKKDAFTDLISRQTLNLIFKKLDLVPFYYGKSQR